MRTVGRRSINISVISLSVIYFFIALTYISFLPNYTLHAHNKHINITILASKYGTSSNSHPWLQKFFKSTPESKKDPMLSFARVILFFSVVAFSCMAVWTLIKPRGELLAYAVSRRHPYLQYRSLRI